MRSTAQSLCSLRGLSFFPSPSTVGDEGNGGSEMPSAPSHRLRQTGSMATTHSWHSQSKRQGDRQGHQAPKATCQELRPRGKQAVPLFHGLPQPSRVPLSHS